MPLFGRRDLWTETMAWDVRGDYRYYYRNRTLRGRHLRIYVHCRAGWQRSAAVAAGVVALRRGIDIDAAVRYVQARKPSADPLPHQRDDLHRWWKARSAFESR